MDQGKSLILQFL